MSLVFRGAVTLLFAVLLYLILADSVSTWVHLPMFGNIGFTLVFVLFALLHCAACAGWRRTGLFFALSAVVSYLFEELGVRTGLIYGPYHYSDMLGIRLGHVPLLIPLAWFMMIYPSWVVARALMRGVRTRRTTGLVAQAMVASLVMTAWDTVMDPGMAAEGNWVWEHGGPYFGVPLRNYFGWLLTTFVVYVGAGLLWRSERRLAGVMNGFAALPVAVYAAYALSYATPRKIPALQVVAVFTMGLPALLALLQVWMAEESPETVDARHAVASATST